MVEFHLKRQVPSALPMVIAAINIVSNFLIIGGWYKSGIICIRHQRFVSETLEIEELFEILVTKQFSANLIDFLPVTGVLHM